MADRTHVIGQLQGSLLQVRHMLFELISFEDIVVSLELLDDVAVHKPDGTIIAEQIKSVTSGNNPTTDRATVFWKTLYNWLKYIKDSSLELDNTVFRMVVSSNRNIESGEIISQFHDATTREMAKEALSTAKLSLWGENDDKKKEIPDTYRSYLDELFSSANEEKVIGIIAEFTLDVHENDYDEKLFDKFSAQTIPPEFVDNLIVYMLGWVHERVNEYANQGVPALIKSEDYRNALVAQCRMYNQQNSIPALSETIADDTARTEVENQDVYIRQLDFIEEDFDAKLQAASDFLRTKAESTLRAEKGLFTPQSLQEYNEKLQRLWKSKQTQISLLAAATDVQKGKNLYAQTTEAAITNIELPTFFGSGMLQSLANEPQDEPAIGWHPRYKEILKGGGGDE